MNHKKLQARRRGSQASSSIADERNTARGIGWARLVRTIILGTCAVTAGIFWGAQQFGIQREVVLSFLTGSLLFVGGLVIAGLLGALLLFLLRKILRNKST